MIAVTFLRRSVAFVHRALDAVRSFGIASAPFDTMSDELERAFAGERPDHPGHRFRSVPGDYDVRR